MILIILALVLGFGLAAATYLLLERGGRAMLAPLLARGVAWSILLLLLLNAAFPQPPSDRRPIVLLDASLSMQAPGGHWAQARDSAFRVGEVRLFGDERPGEDSLPDRGSSRLIPALSAAAVSDRPVFVMTDGDLDDGASLPPDLRDRASTVLFPRDSVPDYAVTLVEGPARVTAGDSLMLDVAVRALAGAPAGTFRLTVRAGDRDLASRSVQLSAGGIAELRFGVPSRGLPPGPHVLAVHLTSGDREPRTDTRLLLVTVAATPGIVLVASPGDWDARSLFRTLVDVAQLPVRGYVELGKGSYRDMRELRPAAEAMVARAAAGADLLVLKGSAGSFLRSTRARGIWRWLPGAPDAGLIAGDWYISVNPGTPVSSAFLGLPVDSFAPATAIVPMTPSAGSWVALQAQDRRRGPARPLVVGQQDGRRRSVTVAVQGLWRWAFRGGQSEQAYRNWVAATASWLLAAPDSASGVARLARAVVQQGRPLIFEWTGSGEPADVPVGWTGSGATRTDTLHFDASGHAAVWLPPGEYSWRLAAGGAGSAVVETYSDEFLPGDPTIASQLARAGVPTERSSARDWGWLFGIALLALALEWWWRRRLGLR